MAFNDKTFPVQRHTFGDARSRGGDKQLLSLTYGYTQQMKRAANAAAAALIAATAVSNTVTTTLLASTSTPIILDVPRAVSITTTGTAASVAATAIVITGRNIEGKVITESLTPTASTLGTISGTKAFKSITSVVAPIQSGTGVSISVGTLNVFGLNHRLPTGLTTANVRIVSVSSVSNLVLTSGSSTTSNVGANGIKTLQSVPTTLNVDPTLVELNTFVPATAPDGTFHMTAHYYYPKWHLTTLNDGTRTIGQLVNNYGVSR